MKIRLRMLEFLSVFSINIALCGSYVYAGDYTIEYAGEETGRSSVLNLQESLLNQHNLDLNEFRLNNIAVYTKAKDTGSTLQLLVENLQSNSIAIKKSPSAASYTSEAATSYFKISVNNPKPGNFPAMTWLLNINGIVKIQKIVINLTDLNAPPPPPPPPVEKPVSVMPNLKSIIASDQAIHVVWQPVPNATYYTVLHSTRVDNKSFQTKELKFSLVANSNLENWVSIIGCNSLGCGPTNALPLVKIAPKASLIRFNPANLSPTQMGISWQPILGVTHFNYLVSNQGFNWPAQTTRETWFILDTNMAFPHWVTVFPCNEAGCGNGQPLGPLVK